MSQQLVEVASTVLQSVLATLESFDAVPVPPLTAADRPPPYFTLLSSEQRKRLARLRRMYHAIEDETNRRSLQQQLAISTAQVHSRLERKTVEVMKKVVADDVTPPPMAATLDIPDHAYELVAPPDEKTMTLTLAFVPLEGPPQKYSSDDEDEQHEHYQHHHDPTVAAERSNVVASVDCRTSSTTSSSMDTPTTGGSNNGTAVIGSMRHSTTPRHVDATAPPADDEQESRGRSSSERSLPNDPAFDFTCQIFSEGLSQAASSSATPGPAGWAAAARQYEPWRPSELALHCDEGQPVAEDGAPVRHTLPVITRTVMRKPAGFKEKDEAMAEQGHYCKSCLCPLEPKFSPLRLGKSWDSAKFCYYTGFYYCKDCHPSTITSVIPARVLMNWDFLPMSVCYDAFNTLEVRKELPLYCISACNPRLYDEVGVLRAARNLRVQLMILRDIGIQCATFRRLFFGWSVSKQHSAPARGSSDEVPTTVEEMLARSSLFVPGADGGDEPCVMPESKRYLVEDSEFWSLADLIDIYNVQPTRDAPDGSSAEAAAGKQPPDRAFRVDGDGLPKKVGPAMPQNSRRFPLLQSMRDISAGISSDCELTELLKKCRSRMIQHVLRQCTKEGGCTKRAAKICPACCKSGTADLVFPFDLNKVRNCSKCGSTYHRPCWNARKGLYTNACLVCMPSGTKKKAASTTPSAPIQR